MYQAELNGKLPSGICRMEDILTSNVFSFFKYSNRSIFLKSFLNKEIKLNITDKEAELAEFIFWPILSKNTEPDLVIIVGDWYLLIEAKFNSDFGEETLTRASQLDRELDEGLLEANNLNKKFKLIAITADYYFKPEKFNKINDDYYVWTNWQKIATLLFNIIESEIDLNLYERSFATDLYNLLIDKKLREYRGIKSLKDIKFINYKSEELFFEAETAQYRGAYIGFLKSLSTIEPIGVLPENIYFKDNQGGNKYG